MISWGYRLGIFFSSWVVAASSVVSGKYFYGGDSSDRFVLGNYEGYISDKLFDELKDSYKVSIDYFDYDHVVKEKFQKKIYDSAIVSTSVLLDIAKSGGLLELDWSKLSIDGSSSQTKENAKEKFSDTVKAILGTSDDLLKYGVPYFLNKLSFCYTGEPIASLKSSVGWKNLVEAIAKEDRFKSKGGRPQLAMIDDPRTIFSMSKLIIDWPKGVNWEDSDSLDGIYNRLKTAGLNTQNMGNNFLLMSPSSSVIVDSLASESIKGGFMYNGDCLYVANGGNVNKTPTKFNVVDVWSDIYFLDFIVFSKHLSGDKLEKAYNFVKKLTFENMDEADVLAKESEKYKYSMIKNFDFVQYTPVLKKPLQQIENKYFENNDPLKEVKKKILKVETNFCDHTGDYYEKPFSQDKSDKLKSDMFRAFEKFKLSL